MKQNLFLDAAANYKDQKILIKERKNKDQVVCHYKVKESHKKLLHHEPGDYFSVKFTDQIIKEKPQFIQKETERILSSFLKKYHKDRPILIVGLGNQEVLADSLGNEVTKRLIATNHYNDFLTIPKIGIINPEVMAKTGISSFKFISYAKEELNPDLIIIIDSLVTNNLNSLNRVIEISDTGIIPGSALRNNKEINKNTFQIPILSIGIPLLYRNEKKLLESVLLKEEIQKLATIVANSLNKTLLM